MKIVCKKEIKESDKMQDSDIIDVLLNNRKIKDREAFLNPISPLKINLSDFGFKKQMKKTLVLLEKIKKEKKMIVVYTDYDADGITGGAILWETLHLLGFKVMPYVPHRKHEGYGFSLKGIDNVKKLYDPVLIISVDHGITASEKIAYAKEKGILTIVTDHHLKPEKLPESAYAIFHEPALSGSSVAYFFAKEIFDHFQGLGNNYPQLEGNFATDYLALAAIGTIADLVPLLGVSRSIAAHGLSAFSKVKRLGIKHILKEAGIEGRQITPYEIGFIIAPRINAVGRLEHAIDALRLLCTKRSEVALTLAGKVGEKNSQRQDFVKSAIEEAKLMLQKRSSKSKENKIIILHSKNWHEGIIGLIASRIAEEYYRPVIVMTESDSYLKGSARSIENFHITDFLRQHKEYLIDVGGHKQAAGFTLEKNKLQSFIETLEKASEKILKPEDLERKIEVDMKIPISKINLSLAKALEKLSPFGIGNPKPTFSSSVEIAGAKVFGKKQDHLKIYAKSNKIGSFPLEFIAFSQGDMFAKLSRGKIVDLVYKLEVDRWGGNERLRGIINQII